MNLTSDLQESVDRLINEIHQRYPSLSQNHLLVITAMIINAIPITLDDPVIEKQLAGIISQLPKD
jgi:hypothetical protein